MPACRHFFSRQAWHWFRWALSTGHMPVPAWHLQTHQHLNSMRFMNRLWKSLLCLYGEWSIHTGGETIRFKPDSSKVEGKLYFLKLIKVCFCQILVELCGFYSSLVKPSLTLGFSWVSDDEGTPNVGDIERFLACKWVSSSRCVWRSHCSRCRRRCRSVSRCWCLHTLCRPERGSELCQGSDSWLRVKDRADWFSPFFLWGIVPGHVPAICTVRSRTPATVVVNATDASVFKSHEVMIGHWTKTVNSCR